MRLAILEQEVGLPPLGEAGVRDPVRRLPFDWAFSFTARFRALELLADPGWQAAQAD